MKIDFLLLSLTLFVSLSFADESAQSSGISAVETPLLAESEQDGGADDGLSQSGSESAAISATELPPFEEAAPIAENPSAVTANASTGTESEEITPSHPGDAYLELALGLYESCKSLGLILDQVHNMPSADAAAPEVAKLADNILELLRSESMLPPPSLEIQQYVQERTSELNTADVSEKAIGRVIDLVAKTDPICYGSAALRSELQRLVRGLLGQ